MIAIASAFLAIAVAEPLQAQITVEKELRLSRLEGLVYDESGKPISEATVSIAQNGVPVQSVVTDKVGGFRIENIQGRCLLHVVSLHHASAYREVYVTHSPDTLYSSPTLYVILRPAGCMDDCSFIVTSRKKFEKILRSYTESGHQ
jgi:hypothetical protein